MGNGGGWPFTRIHWNKGLRAAAVSAGSVAPSHGDGFEYLELDLPQPENSRVKVAEFVKSSPSVAACPTESLPEFALIGRSNVGKSSLINMLTESPGLAKVSKEPGMTKLINHYLINAGPRGSTKGAWHLVDLPGYGFSKTASKVERDAWLSFTKDYFLSRERLLQVLLLVDASLPPQQIDVDCATWLGECQVPFAVVFTKLDSAKRAGKKDKAPPPPARNIAEFKKMLADDWELLPWCFETSAKSGTGRNELLGYLASLRGLNERTSP